VSGWTPTAAAARAAREALDVRASLPRSQRAGTLAGLARARQLAARRHVSDDTVRRMVAFFARNARFADAVPPSKSWQAWNLWGGDAARKDLEHHRMACCNPRPDDRHAAAAHAALARLRMNPPTRESAEMALRRAYDEAVGQARVARFKLDKAATAAAVEDAARYAAALKHYDLEVSVPYQLVEDFAPAPSARQPDLFGLSAGPASMPRPRSPRAEQFDLFRSNPDDFDDFGEAYAYNAQADDVLEGLSEAELRDELREARAAAAKWTHLARKADPDDDYPAGMVAHYRQLADAIEYRLRPQTRSNPAGLMSMEIDNKNDIVTTIEGANGFPSLLRLGGNMKPAEMRERIERLFERTGDGTGPRAAVRAALELAMHHPGHGPVRLDTRGPTPILKWKPDELMPRRNPDHDAAATRDNPRHNPPTVTPRELVALLTQTDPTVFGASREIRVARGEDAGNVTTPHLTADFNMQPDNAIHIIARGPYAAAKSIAARAEAVLRAAGYDADVQPFMPSLVKVYQRAARANPVDVELARAFGLAAQKLDKAKPSPRQRTPRAAAAFMREVMGALSGGVVGPDDVLILSYPLGVSDVITTPNNYRDPSLNTALAQLRAGASHVDLPTGQRAQLARVGPAAVLAAWKRSNPSASPAHTLARYVHGDLAHINGAKIAQIQPEDEKPMRAAIARGWLRKVAGGYMVTRAGRRAVS
jgi:hypothetical protein